MTANKQSKPTLATIYLTEFILQLSHQQSAHIRALSYKEFRNLVGLFGHLPNTFQYKLAQLATLNFNELVLSETDLQAIAEAVQSMSMVTDDAGEAVTLSLEIRKEDSFKDKTFHDCTLCQEARMDTMRNCPLLPEDTYEKGVFYLVGGKKHTTCPMHKINSTNVTNDIMTAFAILNNKVLPEAGGMADQTSWFYQFAPYIVGELKSGSFEDLADE